MKQDKFALQANVDEFWDEIEKKARIKFESYCRHCDDLPCFELPCSDDTTLSPRQLGRIMKLRHISMFEDWIENFKEIMKYGQFASILREAISLNSNEIYENNIRLCLTQDRIAIKVLSLSLNDYLRTYIYQYRHKYSVINSVTMLALILRGLKIETSQPGIILKIVHMNKSSKNLKGIEKIIQEIKVAQHISNVSIINEKQICDFILKRSEQSSLVMQKWMTADKIRNFDLLLEILRKTEKDRMNDINS